MANNNAETGALPFVLHCSPRARGNCADAAELFVRGLAPQARPVPIHRLHADRILPCVACGVCAAPDSPCPLASQDDSGPLLSAIAAAPALCLVSPVHCYHLPAQLKALVDRTQLFWEARRREPPTGPTEPARPLWVILLGARTQGDKLFEGSLLTLRYSFVSMGLALMAPLCLRGVDAPGSLAEHAGHRAAIARYAAEASNSFRLHHASDPQPARA